MGNQNEVTEKVWELATQAAQQNGCSLYDLEFVRNAMGRVLRVYIDRPEGVSITDCELVSRALNLQLDVEDMIPGGSYHLEVSSPGLDRALKRPEHYKAVVGQQVKVRLKTPLSGTHQKQYLGPLVAVFEDGIEIEVNGIRTSIPFGIIEKGHLVFEFPKNKKPNKK